MSRNEPRSATEAASAAAGGAECGTSRPQSGMTRLAQTQRLVAAAVLGVFTSLLVMMIWTAMSNRGQLPPLTLDDFEHAKQRWQTQAPPNYDVTIDVAGRQAAVYHVEVRSHEVIVSTRDGIPLKQRRTRGTWSVPGMFNTMQSDVDNAEQHRLGTADEGVPQVKLRAVFDPEFGYPKRYHRTELRKFGNNEVVSWEVRQFEVVSTVRSVELTETSKSDDGTLK